MTAVHREIALQERRRQRCLRDPGNHLRVDLLGAKEDLENMAQHHLRGANQVVGVEERKMTHHLENQVVHLPLRRTERNADTDEVKLHNY